MISPGSSKVWIRQLSLGPSKNFIYLLGPSDGPEVAVVDPAWDADAIAVAIAGAERKLTAIFLTHAHGDHCNAVEAILQRLDVPVYAQRSEIAFAPNVFAPFGEALQPIDHGDRLAIGTLEGVALHTPGHTPGSQCLLAPGNVLTGDTLFVDTCGNCSQRGGDAAQLFASLHATLSELPEDTVVWPGHDYGSTPVSTMGNERRHNPYFQRNTLADFVNYRMRS